MRILLVHNFYGSSVPSGENRVYEEERDLLLRNGHEVFEFTRHSDEIINQGVWGKVKGALATPWNPWITNAIRLTVERLRPDIVHVHNCFPLFHRVYFMPSATEPLRSSPYITIACFARRVFLHEMEWFVLNALTYKAVCLHYDTVAIAIVD